MIERRKFLIGLGASLLAAPTIVRAASLMPVKTIEWNDLDRWRRALLGPEIIWLPGEVFWLQAHPDASLALAKMTQEEAAASSGLQRFFGGSLATA